jgi:hypothetical protein
VSSVLGWPPVKTKSSDYGEGYNMFRDAQIEGRFSNHSLRATGATTLFDAGVSEAVIQKHTGHKSISAVCPVWAGNDNPKSACGECAAGNTRAHSVWRPLWCYLYPRGLIDLFAQLAYPADPWTMTCSFDSAMCMDFLALHLILNLFLIHLQCITWSLISLFFTHLSFNWSLIHVYL